MTPSTQTRHFRNRRIFEGMTAFAIAMAIAMPSFAEVSHSPHPATVLFDEGHGQHFLVGGKAPLDLSRLASLFEAEGFLVGTGAQQIDDTILSGADVLVISGPFRPYTADEIAAVLRFLDRGGRVTVMLHIAPPVAPLLGQLGLLTSNGVIREHDGVIADDPLNFHVTNLAVHALTSGVASFDVYGAWALLPDGKNSTVVAETGATAWVDLNHDNQQQPRDAVQSFAVVAAGNRGAGRYVVFGDDALFQNNFLKGGNELLARNLVRWLR